MEANTFYHIYNRANGSENMFRCDENYRYFLQQWAKYIDPIAETYAYCLMPNHFHFLIKIKSARELQGFKNLGGLVVKKEEKTISQQFSNMFNSYTKAFNKMHDRKGSLFSPNFKSKEISSDNYFTNVIFYIHHNPVHHGFTKQVENWPHSSYAAILSNKQTQLQRGYVQKWFGGKRELVVFHKQALKELNKLELEYT